MLTEPQVNLEQFANIQETIRFPQSERPFVHISSNKDKYAKSFGEFASSHGFDEQKAQTFFWKI